MIHDFTIAVFNKQPGTPNNEALAVWEKSPQYESHSGKKGDPLETYVLAQAREGYSQHPDKVSVVADDSRSVIPWQPNSVQLNFEVWHFNGIGFEIREHAIQDIWMYGRPHTSASLILKVHSVNVGMIPDQERSEEQSFFILGLSN